MSNESIDFRAPYQLWEKEKSISTYLPTIAECYRNAWQQLWKYVGRLLLIHIIYVLLTLPENILGIILSIIYFILIEWPLLFSLLFVDLKASRDEKPRVADLFYAFKNYGNSILAFFLTLLIVLGGLILFIIPGIIWGCKLAFVPYLVVDKKQDVLSAIKQSWQMTRGYAWKVFFINLVGIPICLAGLLCLVVGIIPAILWVGIANASLYHAVDSRYYEA